MKGIYNINKKMETALRSLNNSDIPKKNKDNIKGFVNFLSSKGVTVGRQYKYVYPLKRISKWLGKDFTKATKQDIQRICSNINSNPEYSAWTKMDYMVVIKKFYRWLYNKDIEDEDEWTIPVLVKFIKINKPKDAKKIPSDLLYAKDIKFLVDHCQRLREKAILMVLFESGARIGEILSMCIKDVTFDDYGCQINVNGKTGYRKVRLVGSSPMLSQWINSEHPRKDDKEAFVFCNIQNGKEGTQMDYNTLRKIFVHLKKRSGFNKPLNFHHFRHSAATHLAAHLTDA
ncbi:unnamed protein product, partial [marine sediment metagenome]